jgi:mercuric ion transport protein
MRCCSPEGLKLERGPMSEAINTLEATSTDGLQRWSLAASLSSITSAFLASICCVGPLLFALLGVGGAGLLLKLGPYRLHFMALTFALLGIGFYLTYRWPKTAPLAEGSDACACPAPRAHRASKIMLWIATLLVTALLMFPFSAPVILGGGDDECASPLNDP